MGLINLKLAEATPVNGLWSELVERLGEGALLGERGLGAVAAAGGSDAGAAQAPLSVTLTAHGPVEYVAWPMSALIAHLSRRPAVRATILAMVAAEEARKLRLAEERLATGAGSNL